MSSLIILFSLVCCDSRLAPAVPGHVGRVISPAAQEVLQTLNEKTLSGKPGEVCPGEWKIGRFAVIPNLVSTGGKGPVLMMRQGETMRYIPMESDGDVVDLYQRVTGRTPKALEGNQSDAYRAFWKR